MRSLQDLAVVDQDVSKGVQVFGGLGSIPKALG
jgi:hypothetical protein